MSKKYNSCSKFSKEFIRRWIKAQEQRAELDHISRDAHCRDEGREEKAAQIAINLMKMGMSLDFIMETVELSWEKQLDLARKNNIEIF